MFEFEYPYAWLLIVIFAIGAKYFKPKEDALLLPGPQKKLSHFMTYKWIFKWLGILLFVFALSSPITKDAFLPHQKPAHAIMVALDTSKSMQQQVIRGNEIVNKFIIAKDIASDFIKKRHNDHVGVVAFGNFAYVATPLSFDTKASSQIMLRMSQGVAGDKTALRDAIFMSMRMLSRSLAKEKVVIVLTDGYDTASKIPPKVLLRALEKQGVKVYSIGIGDSRNYDKRFLEFIAKQTRGKFYQARNQSDLKDVYKDIDTLEKSNLKEDNIVQKEYLFQYPLFFSLLFFILYISLKMKRIHLL